MDTRVFRNRIVGIFFISFAAIAYQVLLTRIFSVSLYYHFAFVGISLSMLGMTIGAQKVYLNKIRFTPQRFEIEWVKAALGFAVSSIAFVCWFLCAPLFLPNPLVMLTLAASLLLFIIPFTYSGICVTLILVQSERVGKLYAADLVGAAVGCIGVVVLLPVIDPVTLVFLLGVLSAWAAWRVADNMQPLLRRIAAIVGLILFSGGLVHGISSYTGHAHIGIFWAKGNPQGDDTLFEQWNAFSRVRVVPWTVSDNPFGWGFGHHQMQHVDQRYIDIDAGAGTVMTRFDGDRSKVAYLANDIINVGYHLRPVKSVVVIGAGGGRDILSALYFQARSILALELNPTIVKVLADKFAEYNGHIASRPDVTLINAEARSWLAQHRPQVDLVQISLIDTWAATAAGGLTLSENRLYTLDAWKEFTSRLTPDGMLVVSRWYDSDNYRGELYRLLSLASETLKARGVPAQQVSRHILAFNQHAIVTVATSMSPFTPEELAVANRTASEQGFDLIVAPGKVLDETSQVIASGAANKEFYESMREDFTAPTDDRPFFFLMTRLSHALESKKMARMEVETGNALSILLFTLVGTLLVTFAFIIDPLLKEKAKLPLREVANGLAFFGAIGVGFMLIEISQMQRLMVFLGHPVYGLCVVLFTLLLFGGIGSATVRDGGPDAPLWQRPLMLIFVLTLVGIVTPAVTSSLVTADTQMRILVSVLLLAPAGFCMGTMFPTGMQLTAAHKPMQPWFWGINGAASVFSSILGMVLSMVWGITIAYWCGVMVYAFCVLLTLNAKRKFA